MKQILIALTFAVTLLMPAGAQGNTPHHKREHRFSPEEFQAKQREYITKKANLTAEEADAFFPLFFELQKEKFRIEREARGKTKKERGQKLTDEEIKELLTNIADARITIAQLEKSYITKYLDAVSPKALMEIQHAERSFQSYIIKSMAHGNDRKEPREAHKHHKSNDK